MRLSRALEDKKMDLRLRDKLVHEGKLSTKDVDKYLSALSDDAEKLTLAGRQGESEKADAPTEP